MKVKIIDSNFNHEEFNKYAAHPMQSWEWGEAKKQLGNDVYRIGEFEGLDLKNVFQMTLHRIPYTSYSIGYIPRSLIPCEETLQFLLEFGKKSNVLFIKMEPNVIQPAGDIVQDDKSLHNKQLSLFQLHKKIIKSSHPLFPEWTQIADLSKSEDDLFKDLKSKTRYNIRLAEKKEVTIKEESNEKGFEIFRKLYFETTKRQKYYGHDEHYQNTIWEHMKKGIAHILIAYFQEMPLASYELFYFNNILYYPYGGSSEQYRNLMGANLLMWNAILLGKKLGAKRYDMWGSLPPTYDEKDPWAGFTRFKEGYNAEFVNFIGSYDLVMNPAIYKMYSIAYRARNALLKMRT